MRRGSSSISGHQIQHRQPQWKRKRQSDTLDNSSLPPSKIRGRARNRSAEASSNRPDITQSEGDEFLTAHSRKRARTRPGQANTAVKTNTKTKSPKIRSRSVQSEIPSSQQSRCATDDSRSFTLSAEPPPGRRLSVTPPIEEQICDPDFELKERAKEEFRETGNYSAFHTLLAPFRKGSTKRELSDWVYNEEKQRWRREDKSTGLSIWAPTSESFL